MKEKKMNDEQLVHLAEEIDNQLVLWGTSNRLPPTSLAGVILGRLVIMSRQTGCVEDLSALLNSVQYALVDTPKNITH
jgi:hypothetical protein